MVGDSDSAGMPGAHMGDQDAAEMVGDGYSELLERVPAIVYIADAGETGRWHYVSPQIEHILGYTPAAWCADPELWADRLHPDDREWVVTREAGGRRRSRPPSAKARRSSTGCSTATAGWCGSATTPC